MIPITAQHSKDKPYMAISLALSSGGFLVAVMEHPDAEKLFAQFQEGSLPAVIGEHNFKCAPGPSWRVKSTEIISVRVMSPEEIKALQQQQGVTAGEQMVRRNASGLPY